MKLRTFILATCSVIVASTAAAQVTINQTKALAGNVTSGDAPGYPVTLSQPGAYKLTSDLVVPEWSKGVVIAAAFVTLDLNGFSIRSTNHCTSNTQSQMLTCPQPNQSTAHGVESPNNHTIIRNGRIYGFSGHGISGAGGEKLEDLTVYGNARYGYVGFTPGYAEPNPGHIVGSRFFSNGHMGAFARNTLIERSQFSYNASKGLRVYGGTVIDSMIVGNLNGGFEASDAARPTTIKGTTWHDNGGSAIVGAGNTRSLGGNFDGSTPF
jgi:hypothetical protein